MVPEEVGDSVGIQRWIVGVDGHFWREFVHTRQAAPGTFLVLLFPPGDLVEADTELSRAVGAVHVAISREVDWSLHDSILAVTKQVLGVFTTNELEEEVRRRRELEVDD